MDTPSAEFKRQSLELVERMTEMWPNVSGIISVPHTKRQYNKMVKYLDMLIDGIGNDQDHPLASLMETLATLIETYEDKHLPEPQPARPPSEGAGGSDPIGVLKSLMAEHDLKQEDMKEIGSQGVVSEILNGKRTLNTRQIQALAARFNVSTAVFM